MTTLENYESYTITEHAKKRLVERFNVPNNESNKWKNRFFLHADYDSSGAPRTGTEKWTQGSITCVIDRKNRQVVTVYPNVDRNYLTGLNPTVVSEIKKTMTQVERKAKRTQAQKLSEYYQELGELTAVMADTRRGEYLDASYERMVLLQGAIDKINAGTSDVLESIKLIAQ